MLHQTVQLLVLVCALSAALAARESYTAPSGLTTTITRRVPPQNCTIWSQNGDTLCVHYTGSLEDGTVFDTSYKGANTPWCFVLGARYAIVGYDLALVGMCVGEQRELIVPSSLGYGDYGFPAIGIPGGATLYFVDDLMSISRPSAAAPSLDAGNI
jgi:FK506-binding protein 2